MNIEVKQEQPTSIAELVATESGQAATTPAMREVIGDLRGIQAALEENLRALALVRLTHLLRRIDREESSEEQQ